MVVQTPRVKTNPTEIIATLKLKCQNVNINIMIIIPNKECMQACAYLFARNMIAAFALLDRSTEKDVYTRLFMARVREEDLPAVWTRFGVLNDPLGTCLGLQLNFGTVLR